MSIENIDEDEDDFTDTDDGDRCPECGELLEGEDWHYIAFNNCCKCCYDDHHFGEEENT